MQTIICLASGPSLIADVLSEQPPTFAGHPPDRPDPPPASVHGLLWIKVAEKVVSESRPVLAQCLK